MDGVRSTCESGMCRAADQDVDLCRVFGDPCRGGDGGGSFAPDPRRGEETAETAD